MLLLSSIALEPKPPVRIWQGQSVLSLNTQKNWKLIRKDTLSGAVQPEPVWQRGLGPYGPAAFGGDDLPQPSAVIMQYTGHSDYTENDPPTFACVGERDGIANWRTMQRRIEALDALGISTEFHHYPGLPHGFGLGTGTVAEGWLDEAVQFWEAQM